MSTNKQTIFGIHAVSMLIQKHPDRVIRLLVTKDRNDKKIANIIAMAENEGMDISYVTRAELDGMSDNGNHQGVAALTARAQSYSEADLEDFLQDIDGPAFLLILDGVQDPHNLGACFRSADAAGVHAIIAPKDKATGITPVVSKVACGAAEVVPFIQVTNLARTIDKLKELGVWIYGAAGEATSTIYQSDFIYFQ